MQTYQLPGQNAIARLSSFIAAGGPEENEYKELTDIWDGLNKHPGNNSWDELLRLFGQDFLNQTAHGFSYRKPLGYAGDFEIIDKIYQQKICGDKKFQKWDKYYYSREGCKAVRNRKNYFIKLVREKCSTIERPLRILNIASGPCRDLLELLEQVPAGKLKVHCVEMDPKAIAYAGNLLGSFSAAVKFTQKNIFKFNTEEKFDLVWSAGLFDYFEDDVFIKLLLKVRAWCAPAGEMVIGNFSDSNPSRSYMENAIDWKLFHRSGATLKTLALKAGFDKDQVTIASEPLGVNLFLHLGVK